MFKGMDTFCNNPYQFLSFNKQLQISSLNLPSGARSHRLTPTWHCCKCVMAIYFYYPVKYATCYWLMISCFDFPCSVLDTNNNLKLLYQKFKTSVQHVSWRPVNTSSVILSLKPGNCCFHPKHSIYLRREFLCSYSSELTIYTPWCNEGFDCQNVTQQCQGYPTHLLH